jgi:hypothetical protein
MPSCGHKGSPLTPALSPEEKDLVPSWARGGEMEMALAALGLSDTILFKML